MASSAPLRVGYVPEHFSTPLHYAVKYFSLSATLVAYPSGTGAMIAALRGGELDAAIGLTEGWVAGLGTQASGASAGGYSLVACYVESPLCWAISTGARRPQPASVADLAGSKMGVSRIGSGSYVMGFVLAEQSGWLREGQAPFDVVPLGTFAELRRGVNDAAADFFMWEHFTSKRYFDGEDHSAEADSGQSQDKSLIRKIGEIYTPWPSWHIVAVDKDDERLGPFFEALDQGIEYFGNHPDENVDYISTALDYTREDATEWLKTVKFSVGIGGVKKSVVENTIQVLKKAGVLVGDHDARKMLGIQRAE